MLIWGFVRIVPARLGLPMAMKILVAEDDRMYQLLLSKVLAQWGYSPIMAWDGEKAWETLNSPAGPQLAIVDWVMPGTDGMEICRRVRGAKLPHYVYVVLLTSKTDEGDLLAGLEAGADDYLPKPVNLHQLKLRLRAATRVLEAEKGHRMIAEIASDGIVTMGGAGTIQFANSSAGAIFGYPANELIGKPFSALVPDFAEPARLADVEPAVAPARSWAAVELSGRHQSGRQIPLEVSLAEFSEGAQEPLVTAVIRDVTERKARDCQLAHIQKLESIGQLAAGVAHEINTPIQYIGDNLRFIQGAFRSMAQVLDAARGSEDAGDVDRLAQALDLNYVVNETPQAIQQAIEGAERVTEIVKALKEFSHPGSFQTTPVDLNHLLENAVLISRNKWKSVADLRTELDASLPPVRCLAGELSQVFLNLIVNAADAIASAQQEEPERKGELLISTRHDGQFAEVRVQDNGTGIPREAQTRVFDPFFTTKPVGSGTGQGLAIAYTIVARKHRGSIEFETEVGAGTTFIVTLPIDGPEIQATEILENRDAARRYLATNLKSEIAISSLP
jgi:PAS domain S-box-containing protein